MNTFAILACATLALGACTRWSPRPVPVSRAFATDTARDVAVRLGDDSTHWWRIRQARLQGDSVVGVTKSGGSLRRVAVPRDSITTLVVREPDRVVNQLAEVVGLLGMLAFVFSVAPRGWSL